MVVPELSDVLKTIKASGKSHSPQSYWLVEYFQHPKTITALKQLDLNCRVYRKPDSVSFKSTKDNNYGPERTKFHAVRAELIGRMKTLGDQRYPTALITISQLIELEWHCRANGTENFTLPKSAVMQCKNKAAQKTAPKQHIEKKPTKKTNTKTQKETETAIKPKANKKRKIEIIDKTTAQNIRPQEQTTEPHNEHSMTHCLKALYSDILSDKDGYQEDKAIYHFHEIISHYVKVPPLPSDANFNDLKKETESLFFVKESSGYISDITSYLYLIQAHFRKRQAFLPQQRSHSHRPS